MHFKHKESRPLSARIKTLIVDDCEVVRASLVRLLATMPFVELIGIAASGLDAIEMTADKQPQLVLMDFQMPGLNGLEAMRLIRDLHPATRVILMSAHDLSQVEECHGVGGADAFVPKKNLFNELQATILRLFAY